MVDLELRALLVLGLFAAGCGADSRKAAVVEESSRPRPKAAPDSTVGQAQKRVASVTGEPRCLPVAQCTMFRRWSASADTHGLCAIANPDGSTTVTEDARRRGNIVVVDRMCEGEYDLKGLVGCFDFIETQMSCYYRAPNLPDYACAFVAGECVAVSSAAQPPL